MKVLLQRTKTKDTNRFCQSFQSFNQITQARNKLYSTSHRNSFYLKKDKCDKNQDKLPILSQSFLSSNAKNAQQKVQSIGERLTDLQNKVLQLKLQTRETRRYANFIKEDLGQRQIVQHKHNLMQKVYSLDKLTKLTKHGFENKTVLLKQSCIKLNHFSSQLKQMLQSIARSLDTLENAMGVYSAKEKHKM